MKGLLVRVGIDKGKKNGYWNAPCRADGSFCYVPIPIGQGVFRAGFETTYDEFENCCNGFAQGIFPAQLQGTHCHLDPDFRFLSYGDTGNKATRIRDFFRDSQDNFIAFYAGLKQIAGNSRTLVYAIIGLYRFRNVQLVRDIPPGQWDRNAHTRLADREDDIVIFADQNGSGRLRKSIPIGEQHDNKHYYVRNNLLQPWGGISTKNGWIQRSGGLPKFNDPELFLQWFEDQKPQFVQQNNIV
jgi:hypothetical protein